MLFIKIMSWLLTVFVMNFSSIGFAWLRQITAIIVIFNKNSYTMLYIPAECIACIISCIHFDFSSLIQRRQKILSWFLIFQSIRWIKPFSRYNRVDQAPPRHSGDPSSNSASLSTFFSALATAFLWNWKIGLNK